MTTKMSTIVCLRCQAHYSTPSQEQIRVWQVLHWRDCTNLTRGDAT